MISVLVLTHNEEANLEACLRAVAWSDDVVVLDSFSSDRTVEIARSFGARVEQRAFDSERSQREASLRLGFKHPWVYNPDADEIATPELRDEMLHIIDDPKAQAVAYRVRFKTMFMGKWIKHSSLYPTWVMRLFRPERIRFERRINLAYLADGPCGRLQSHFLHCTFNKGLQAWLEKHVRYAMVEAEESLASLSDSNRRWRGSLLCRDSVERRRAWKELSFRLPLRPSLRFVYMFLMRGGFLDGTAGLRYCQLLAMYERMIMLRMEELRRGRL